MNKRTIAVSSLLAILVVAYVGYRHFFPETLSSAANKLLGCAISGNAGCLWPYVTDQEKKQYGLTEAKLQALLSQYVSPSYSDYKAAGGYQGFPNPSAGEYLLSQRYEKSNGVTTDLSVTAVLTDNGIKAPGLTSMLLLGSLHARHIQEKDEDKLSVWLRGIREDAPQLKSLGFEGYTKGDKAGPMFMSWEVAQQDISERIAKRDALRKQRLQESG